jgi:hypothetical protein
MNPDGLNMAVSANQQEDLAAGSRAMPARVRLNLGEAVEEQRRFGGFQLTEG